MTDTLQPDVHEIERALKLLQDADQVFEIRALGVIHNRHSLGFMGYFDNAAIASREIVKELNTAEAVYVTLNEIHPDLPHRVYNRVQVAEKGNSTSADHVRRRRWVLIDNDPSRLAKISTTEDEHTHAIEVAGRVRQWLRDDYFFPDPIYGDSGNGGHLLYRVDLPTDDGGLVQRFLEALAYKFSDDRCAIDTSVADASRISKVYGTPARKGDHTPKRPHRLARLLEVPDQIEVITTEQVQRVIDDVLPPMQTVDESAASHDIHGGRSIDIDAWLKDHNISMRGPYEWQSKDGNKGRRWILDMCQWNKDHTDNSAYIVQLSSGAIAAGCKHNSCQGKGWHDLRDTIEPGWGERQQDSRQGQRRERHAFDFGKCIADLLSFGYEFTWNEMTQTVEVGGLSVTGLY
jgi:hypothetical protein